jgi:hypothetical protein
MQWSALALCAAGRSSRRPTRQCRRDITHGGAERQHRYLERWRLSRDCVSQRHVRDLRDGQPMERDPLVANRQAVLGGHMRHTGRTHRGQRTSVRPRTVMESHGPNGQENSPSAIPTTKPERRRERSWSETPSYLTTRRLWGPRYEQTKKKQTRRGQKPKTKVALYWALKKPLAPAAVRGSTYRGYIGHRAQSTEQSGEQRRYAHSPVHMQAGRRCGVRCCLLFTELKGSS